MPAISLDLGSKHLPGTHILTGEINEDTARETIEFILGCHVDPDMEAKTPLTLIINSGGGDLYSGLGIVDAIETSSMSVRTVGLGLVGSAALIIFMAGTKGQRFLTKNCSVLSHQFSGGGFYKRHEMLSHRGHEDDLNEKMIKHYMEHTGLKKKVIEEKLLPPQDVWLTSEQCVKFGICDKILEKTFTKVKFTPEELATIRGTSEEK